MWVVVYIAALIAIGLAVYNNRKYIFHIGMDAGSLFCKLQYAELLREDEDYAEAYPLFIEAADAGYDEALIASGECATSLGDYSQAASLFERAYFTDIYSNQSDYDNLASSIAFSYYNAGDYNAALSWSDIAADAGVPDGYEVAGWCHYQLGDIDTAIASFSKAVELGDSGDGLYGLACCYERNGDVAMSTDYYRQAAQAGSQPAVKRLEELGLSGE